MLLSTSEILTVQEEHHTRGVRFGSMIHGSSEVIMDFTKWLDMGRPGAIVVDIRPARAQVTAP